MTPRLPAMTSRDVVQKLKRAGFCEWRQTGSHLSMYNEKENKALTIPIHFKKDIPIGTLRSIIRESGLTVEEFLAL